MSLLGLLLWGRVDIVGFESHLLRNGIDRSYTCWIFHGDKSNGNVEPRDSTTYASNDNGRDIYDYDRVEEIAEALEEDLKDCPKMFERLVSDYDTVGELT